MTQVAEQPGSTAGRLGSVVLDCPDPHELAQFYSALLGWRSTRTVTTTGGA